MLRTLAKNVLDRTPALSRQFTKRRRQAQYNELIRSGRYDPDPDREVHFDDYERAGPDEEIPHTLHQIWDRPPVPDRYTRLIERLKETHPDWAYELWTEEPIETLVREKFGHWYEKWKLLPKNIMRLDLARYMILHTHGGVYLDMDVWFQRSMDALVDDCRLLLPAETDVVADANFIAQHLVGSVPGHPFWPDCLAMALDQPDETLRGYDDPIDCTGPQMVTRAWRQAPEKYRAKIPMRVYLCPPSYLQDIGLTLPEKTVSIHLCSGAWRE